MNGKVNISTTLTLKAKVILDGLLQKLFFLFSWLMCRVTHGLHFLPHSKMATVY